MGLGCGHSADETAGQMLVYRGNAEPNSIGKLGLDRQSVASVGSLEETHSHGKESRWGG